jgi:hypothetical protein
MTTDTQAAFQGFQSPNTTPVPDELFDKLLPILSGAELKILLYVIRRTFGFKKGSDRISKSQLEHGITKSDGSTLDGGTGLSRRAIRLAIDSLVGRNILIKLHNKSPERGHEATEYALNIANTPPGVKSTQGVWYKVPKPLGREVPPQQTVVQETVKQETDNVVAVATSDVAVAKDLQNFGIAKSAVTKLMQDYPKQYIREKLAIAQGLVSVGSALVSQNPAGWLRRAIEEDYAPPRNHQRSRQHKAGEAKPCTRRYGAKETTIAQTETREQQVTEEGSQQAQYVTTQSEQTVSTETGECSPNVATQCRENRTEKKLPEKTSRVAPDSARENEITWKKTLEQLREALPVGEAATHLTGTVLVALTDTAAYISVPTPHAVAWLERRLYGQIAKALKGILGKDLDLQFIAAS